MQAHPAGGGWSRVRTQAGCPQGSLDTTAQGTHAVCPAQQEDQTPAGLLLGVRTHNGLGSKERSSAEERLMAGVGFLEVDWGM